MKNSKLYNAVKRRKATANEIAKHLIEDRIQSIFIAESYGLENITDEESLEIARHLNKHLLSIQKRIRLDHLIVK